VDIRPFVAWFSAYLVTGNGVGQIRGGQLLTGCEFEQIFEFLQLKMRFYEILTNKNIYNTLMTEVSSNVCDTLWYYVR
jgi:hypothetical protein